MTQKKWLFLRGFFFASLFGVLLSYGLLSFSQSPRRIEERIEIGADVDTIESVLLAKCCSCSPSPCSSAGSFVTLPYAGDVWAEVTSSEAGAPIIFGLAEPSHVHFWDDAREHVGEDTLVGSFEQGAQLLFHIHPGGPCSAYIMYPVISGSAPCWTLEFEDYWDCDWDDLVVEIRLCPSGSDSVKISLSVDGGGSAEIDPGGSLNLVTAVTDSHCNPIDSFRIEFDVDTVPQSGGHGHDGNTPNGAVSPDTGLTNYDGLLATTFTAPTCTCGPAEECSSNTIRGIAGVYIVWARSRDDANLWDSLHIHSRIFLDSLETGDHWMLWGGTQYHPLPTNHFGTAASNQHLREIGTEFDSTMLARGYEIDEGTVKLNDQSLEWGGLFDIGPQYGLLWHCPHCGHHHGRTCDIVKFQLVEHDTVLERIISEHGSIGHDDDHHWDVTFPE